MERSEVPMLVVYEGELSGQRWFVEGDAVLIGRGSDCDVILPERQVSRHHARIERMAEGVYVLRDLGSKNGTHVNGEEVRDRPRVLEDGDEIQIALCVKLGFVGADATLPLMVEGPTRGLRVDRASHRVFVGGHELTPPLSPAQYRLLTTLLDAEGGGVSREEIVGVVWAEEAAEGISEQAIDALVRRLRERLAALDPEHNYVVTVRGHGFRLENR
ncbi:MAG TPA: FHA domain-containing protein [Anaerolineae bacterium]|nr:FHA domain-containing protein [Anaerolineae bacterium]